MPIIKHQTLDPHLTISNSSIELIRDITALSLFVYLSSLDFVSVTTEQVMNHFEISKEEDLKGMAHLKEMGLLE